MKRVAFLLFVLFMINVSRAQLANVIPSSTAIAHTSVSATETWSAFQNPAMLGYILSTEIGLQYENRFLLHELSTKSLSLGLHSSLLNTGLSFSHFGYSQYHEMMVGLAFARNFSDKFALGVQFNYYTAYFAASRSYRGTFFPQIGISYQFSPAFSIGFNAFNPIQTKIDTELTTKRIPSIFSIGTDYHFSPDFAWRTQIDKELSSNYRFATGFEYQMMHSVSVKLGAYHANYLVPCLGLGLKAGSFLFDLNCELHPVLGLNTMAGLKFRFAK